MSGREARAAVAVGGGTGLPVVLRTLLELGYEPTAVVTMADDGGSSGTLRRALGMLPPGDARNCLVALADPASPFTGVFEYRFAQGEGLEGHSLGNLVIAALSDTAGGFAEALEAAGRLLGSRGRVLPSTLADVALHALDADGNEVRGQAAVARSEAPIARACLEPEHPAAYPPALEAIASADAVVIGPGSLYTSVIPNFLVDGVADALRECRGRRVYLCNVANQRGETSGMDAPAHVAALLAHGLEGAIDAVLVHDCKGHEPPEGVEPVCGGSVERAVIRGMGPEVFANVLAERSDPFHHAPGKLPAALAEVLGVLHR